MSVEETVGIPQAIGVMMETNKSQTEAIGNLLKAIRAQNETIGAMGVRLEIVERSLKKLQNKGGSARDRDPAQAATDKNAADFEKALLKEARRLEK